MNASRANSAVVLCPPRNGPGGSDTARAFGAALGALRRLWKDHQRARDEARNFQSIAHLDAHVLKDIGAPHWLVADADLRHETQHLQWFDKEMR